MIEFFRSAGSYIVAIGILVSIHEFGHFWVARRFGIKVLRFSFGFGKPIWKRRGRDGVEYVISAIPLGGYVNLLEERGEPVPAEDIPRAFNRKPVLARIAVLAAGAAFNFLLAIAIYWGMYVHGVPGIKPVLAEPIANTPAAAAGIHAGDRITRLDGDPVESWAQLQTRLIRAGLAKGSLSLDLVDKTGTARQVHLSLADVHGDPQVLFDEVGLSPYQPPIPPVLGEIMPGSPAEQSHLRTGDRVLALDDVPVKSFQDLQRGVTAHPNEVVHIDVDRGGETLHLSVIPGHMNGAVRIGARPAPMSMAQNDALWQDLRTEMRLGPVAALPAAIGQTWQVANLTLDLLYHMLLGDVSVKNVSGPIQIAQVTGSAVSAGFLEYLWTLALISVSLGVFNLLPVPLLDGGRILYVLVEAAKGSPLSERAQVFGLWVGVMLLALLMGLAFYNDLARLIG